MKTILSIVPKAEPNAKSKDIVVDVPLLLGTSWSDVAVALEPYVPEDYFVIRYRQIPT